MFELRPHGFVVVQLASRERFTNFSLMDPLMLPCLTTMEGVLTALDSLRKLNNQQPVSQPPLTPNQTESRIAHLIKEMQHILGETKTAKSEHADVKRSVTRQHGIAERLAQLFEGIMEDVSVNRLQGKYKVTWDEILNIRGEEGRFSQVNLHQQKTANLSQM